MVPSVACRRPLTGALLVLALFVFGAPWSTSQAAFAQNQTLFISVVDSNSVPVTDLDLDEVVVQWDDEDCETLDLAPISLPVRVTVFIDNGEETEALQHMREGLKGFIAAIPQDVEIALLTIAGQPQWITRHTADRTELARGLNLVVHYTGSATRYMDAWVEEASRLNDDTESQYLPVIVMIAGDGPEGSSITQGRYDQMKQRMVDNLATWHTRVYTGNGRGAADQAQIGIEMGRVTRGTYEALGIANAFRRILPELGQAIARKHTRASHQYRVTYAPPDGASHRPRISVEVIRPDVNLILTRDGNVP